jgi:hypothetical protein
MLDSNFLLRVDIRNLWAGSLFGRRRPLSPRAAIVFIGCVSAVLWGMIVVVGGGFL